MHGGFRVLKQQGGYNQIYGSTCGASIHRTKIRRTQTPKPLLGVAKIRREQIVPAGLPTDKLLCLYAQEWPIVLYGGDEGQVKEILFPGNSNS